MSRRRVKTYNLEHLDAAENIFFARELEFISAEMLNVKYAEGKTRLILPVDNQVPPEDESFTYRMWDSLGAAKAIASPADDLPMTNVLGQELTQRFQTYGLAYGYTTDEIAKSAKLGRPLDRMRSEAVRKGLEQKLDNIAADGDSAYGLKGINSLASTLTYTPATKAAGGLTWAVATPSEIIADVNGMLTQTKTTTKEVESIKRILLPTSQYEILNNTPRSDVSDTTILKFLRDTHPGVEFMSWERLAAAGSNSTDRVIGYDPSREKIRLLMSIEFEQQAPQLRNYSYTVNCRFKTGGVISPYPKSICFMDGV